MRKESAAIVQKLWNCCSILRDDGISFGDYVEQITYLLFLKMADEKWHNKASGMGWQDLKGKSGIELKEHYDKVLKYYGNAEGICGTIFKNAVCKIQDPAKLEKLIRVVGSKEWTSLDIDIKGDMYEGLLQKYAEDIKSGAGQYFTPRQLVKAVIEVMKPEGGMKICDPACGTGGFLICAYEYMQKHGISGENSFFEGWEIVYDTARLCAANLLLHGMDEAKYGLHIGDSLTTPACSGYDMVLTNPPFGKNSSAYSVTDREKLKSPFDYLREDFIASTNNKQLNFLQHVMSMLNLGGRAAVIVPDNVLFQAGAGELIRRKLLDEFEVHTLLRLPKGIFYAQGIKSNILFFDRAKSSENKLWVYDLRYDMHFTLKRNNITYQDLEDFIKCYNADDRKKRVENERFRCFSYEEILKRERVNLDIAWQMKEEVLPEPDTIVKDIIDNLKSALDGFSTLMNK